MTTIEMSQSMPPDAPMEMGQPFRMLLAVVGSPTSDGRQFEDFAIRQPPLTVYSQMINASGHDDAPIAGKLLFAVQRPAEDGTIEVWAYGMLDSEGAAGQETIRLIAGEYLRGVSVDAAIDVSLATVDENGVEHYSGVEIGAATIVGFPAFRETQIELLDVLPDPATVLATVGTAPVAILASAAVADAPPRGWFDNPRLERRTGLSVDAAGRIVGHLYGWGECHIGGPPGRCVTVPRGTVDGSIFASQDGRGVLCSDGTIAPTGPIVLSADHADLGRGMNWQRARDHYAHTGLAVADVACGEDEHGIWVAGMVRPGAPDEAVHALRASAPSGDWRTVLDRRTVGGKLQLVAILMVNMPGFPAIAASLSGGQMDALITSSPIVASGAEHACSCGGGITASGDEGEPIPGTLEETTGPGLAEVAEKVDELHRIITEPIRAARIAEIDEAMAPPPPEPRPALADLLHKA